MDQLYNNKKMAKFVLFFSQELMCFYLKRHHGILSTVQALSSKRAVLPKNVAAGGFHIWHMRYIKTDIKTAKKKVGQIANQKFRLSCLEDISSSCIHPFVYGCVETWFGPAQLEFLCPPPVRRGAGCSVMLNCLVAEFRQCLNWPKRIGIIDYWNLNTV